MQPFLEKYGKQLLIPAGIGIALLLYFFVFQDSTEQTSIETIDPMTSFAAPNAAQDELQQPLEEQPAPKAFLVIDVKGAVKYPGVYTLLEDQRIVDAIEMAGGYEEGANATLINHAQKLQDEMVIYIPKVGEEVPEVMQELVQTAQGSTSSGGTSKSGKINLNKATENELTQLPGIGPSKATAIVKYRTEQGGFKTIEDLKSVSGIGDKTFEQLKDLIDTK